MFRKKSNDNELDVKKLNEVIGLGKRILDIFFILMIIASIYCVTLLFKEWKLLQFLITTLKIVAPFFVGLLLAWLFDPIVKKMKKKGVKRGLGTLIVYVVFIGLISAILYIFIPLLTDQINEFVKTLPSIFDTIQLWINNLFAKLSEIEGFNDLNIEVELFKAIDNLSTSLTTNLPTITVNALKGLFSGLSTFVVGLIIGFFLLSSFDNFTDAISTAFPRKFQKPLNELLTEINTTFRQFVNGALLDCTFVFLITTIGLSLVGLKSAALFGLFCGITNIIPYAGPYIGGAPAVIVGFVQSPTTGILTLVVIAIIQFLEGNFLQPLIMSKTTKLHPVTIMLGLLFFGHFFGIIGMIVSTPIIGAVKAIFMFFNEKYEWLGNNN